MVEQHTGYGDIYMGNIDVIELANLPFGRGKVGLRNPLVSGEEISEFAANQAEHILPLSHHNTADCGDERLTIALANGINDPDFLRNRIVYQLFGGLGLATTKALVAADATAIKSSKSIWDAYMLSNNMLEEMGYEDAGHGDCGASKAVKSSVTNPIERSLLIPSIGLFVPDDGGNEIFLDSISVTKQRRLESGFYDGWDPANQQDFLVSKFPHNFSYLKIDPDDQESQGHNGRGLLVITEDGFGYQKTGEAFAMTLSLAKKLANDFGVSDEERRRILLAFVDDSAHVAAGIVAEGFPVFAQTA